MQILHKYTKRIAATSAPTQLSIPLPQTAKLPIYHNNDQQAFPSMFSPRVNNLVVKHDVKPSLPLEYTISQPAYRTTDDVKISFTSHPTLLTESTTQVRPKLWEEVEMYYSKIAKSPHFLKDVNKGNINSWIGYDMDRHQDERKNIFIYTFLQNAKSQMILKGQNDDCSDIISEIDDISKILVDSFSKNQDIDVTDKLEELKSKIGESEISVINGEYRISAEDLDTAEGIDKINARLAEIKQLETIFGIKPVSEVIIADCTKPEHIKELQKLLNESGLSEISITPLIEDKLDDEPLRRIITSAGNKVMLAGSDSIQRDTYCGALLMKMKIQKIIHEINKERSEEDQITFFEGTGSHIIRNGLIIPSRMGTILEGSRYQRTIQGQQALAVMKDSEYYNKCKSELNDSPRCTLKEMETALPIIQSIYGTISIAQIALQKEPTYTDLFDN